MNDTVLLADDDEGVVKLVRRALSGAPCEVASVSDGDAAARAARESAPALILLDVGMPVRTGWEVLAELRARPSTRLIPVIMLTGHAGDENADKGFALGADDFVAKPFSPVELRARVLGRLRRHREALGVNPLTGLPGTPSARSEVEARYAADRPFALIHADIDRFKAYNDACGFERGDEAIKTLARVLGDSLKAAGERDGFLAHVGGDDFVVVCSAEKADLVAAFAVMRFDEALPSLYGEEARERGWIETRDRRGETRRQALMSLSLGGVRTDRTAVAGYADAARRADEMKSWLKGSRDAGPSRWAFDRRGEGRVS